MKMKHLLLLIPIIASATRIEVNPSQSISKELVAARIGDTVALAEGTYKESVILKSGVVLLGSDPAKVIIQGNGRDATLKLLGSAKVYGITISKGSNGIQTQSGQAVIENCVIAQNRGSGILAVKALPEIVNSVISHNGANGIQGTEIGGGSLIIENITVANNGRFGMSIQSADPISLSNSIFVKNGVRAINTKEGTVIASNNLFDPEQKEFVTNNRSQKVEFEREKSIRTLCIPKKDSPGNEIGAQLTRD